MDHKILKFRGHWLGGQVIPLEESSMSLYRVTLQITKEAYEEMSRLTDLTTHLDLTAQAIPKIYDVKYNRGKINANI